jgi:preprotein translocase SecE subunit
VLTRIRRFIAEAISELRKVSWPTLAQTRNLTVLVFAVSFAVGVFVAVCDTVFKGILTFVATNFAS